MNSVEIISCVIAAAVAFGSLVVCVCNLGVKFGKLEQRVETAELRAQEDRARDSNNFTDLFEFRNSINQTMASVTTSLNTLINKVDDLSKKVDELQREKNK